MADSESAPPSVVSPLAPAAPPPPQAIAPAMPLSDLLTLARAILRETGELPAHPGATPPASAAPAGQIPATGPARGPLPKESKKFYKLGAAPMVAEPVAGQPAMTVAAGSEAAGASAVPIPANGDLAESSGAAPEQRLRPQGAAKMIERTTGQRRSLASRRRMLILKLSAFFAVAALLLGLVFGWLLRPENAAPAAAAAPSAGGVGARPAPNPAKENLGVFVAPDENYRRALRTLDDALAAQQARDWPRAEALFEQAGRESLSLPGIPLRLAELALRRGDLIMAENLANRSLQAGDEVASSYAIRAVLAQRSGNPDRALNMLEVAGRANPYDSRYPLFQSQILRQKGKLQEAANRLVQALRRVEDPTQQNLIQLNLRLTKVELGQDGEFADELAAQLALPTPLPEWLLTAAARELQAGRFKEGAEFMRRALQGQPPLFAVARLSDVFFSRFADRPELAPIYAQFLPKPAPPPPSTNLAPPAFAPSASPAPTEGLSLPWEELAAPAPAASPAAGKPR